MSLPAAIALRSSLARSFVVAASKNKVSSLFLSAALRSVVQRVMPCAFASCSTLAALRPTRIGSGMTRSPFLSATPPCARIATIERIRCWFIPMRPVTPFMMMPSRCCAIAITPFPALVGWAKSLAGSSAVGIAREDGRKRPYVARKILPTVVARQRAFAHPTSSVSLHPQQPVDAPRIFAELLVGLHVERARMRQLDAEIVGHPRWAGAQHDHASAEEHRLGDAVGDEHDGLLRLLPDAEQFQVHLLAGERVECAERLVHENELGIVDQRARDGG